MADSPGTLVIRIDDRATAIELLGGGTWTLPVGPVSLVEGELADGDPPPPAALTNALGTVHDHFDDVIIDAPMVAAVPEVTFAGRHATTLARVEVGSADVPDDYVLARVDADEVFRTLVAEPADQRRHNPGLPADEVESVVGTCCVVLAVLRRLDLHAAAIDAERSR